MRSSPLTPILSILLALTAVNTAHAYMTPGEVFGEQNIPAVSAPPTAPQSAQQPEATMEAETPVEPPPTKEQPATAPVPPVQKIDAVPPAPAPAPASAKRAAASSPAARARTTAVRSVKTTAGKKSSPHAAAPVLPGGLSPSTLSLLLKIVAALAVVGVVAGVSWAIMIIRKKKPVVGAVTKIAEVQAPVVAAPVAPVAPVVDTHTSGGAPQVS